jgi:hypothetical protein
MKDWRAAHPGWNAEHISRWRDANPDRQAQYVREQAERIGTADKYGYMWTGAELEIVVTRRDLTLTQLAKLLGRTRQAVISARHRATRDPKWSMVAGVSRQESPDA